MTRVEDIQNRLSAATPGPWTLDRYDHGGGRAYVTDPKRRIVCDAFKENDREFLFNSASDLTYLLAELRKAREALAVVEHWTGRFETNQSSDIAKRQNAQFDLGYSAGRRSAGSILRDAVAAAMGDGE
jgi:hypothetical protein